MTVSRSPLPFSDVLLRHRVQVTATQRWADAFDADPHRRKPTEDLAFWKQHAANYDSQCGAREHTDELWQSLSKLIPAGCSVLDVGCGTGRFTLLAAKNGCHVLGVDQSPEVLEIAWRKIDSENLDIRLLQLGWPSVLPEKFDVALAAWSLYGHRDIASALLALIAASTKRVVIVDSIGLPSCHGTCTQNRAVDLAGCISELGYVPNIIAVHERQCEPPRAVGIVWFDIEPRYLF